VTIQKSGGHGEKWFSTKRQAFETDRRSLQRDAFAYCVMRQRGWPGSETLRLLWDF